MKKVKFFNNMQPSGRWSILIPDLFLVSLMSYLIILVVEEFSAAFFTTFFNLRWLLAIVILTGMISFFVRSTESSDGSLPSKLGKPWGIGSSFVIGVVAGIAVIFGGEEFRWMGLILAVLTTILVTSMAYLVLAESEESSPE